MAASEAWYGELRTKRGNTIVIKDDDLPRPATQGRIYLYNTEREQMVEYVEAIIADKLFELDEEQQQVVAKKFNSGWESAKKKLNKANGKSSPEDEPKQEAKSVSDEIEIEEVTGTESDDDYDDDE